MKIAVFGLGKLGSCIAAVLAQKHTVVGVDVNPDVVEAITAGQPPPRVSEPALNELLEAAFGRGSISATLDPIKAISGADMAIIIVPTPSRSDGLFASDYVADALNKIAFSLNSMDALPAHPLTVVIVSTLTPGSVDALNAQINMMLEQDDEVELIYSPVFVALGSVVHNLCNPDALLIGTGNGTETRGAQLWQALLQDAVYNGAVPVKLMTWTGAEMSKLTLNVFLSVKSLWANEIAILAQAAGVNASPILEFIGLDRRIGPKMLRPGFPPGGPCLPRDVRCMFSFARLYEISTNMLSALLKAKDQQFAFIANEIALLSMDVPVGIVGFAYKPGTPITEDSGAINLARLLWQKHGIETVLYDIEATLPEGLPKEIASTTSLDELLDACPVVVIGTDDLRYIHLLEEADLDATVIYDVWGLLRGRTVARGLNYFCFGENP